MPNTNYVYTLAELIRRSQADLVLDKPPRLETTGVASLLLGAGGFVAAVVVAKAIAENL